MVYHGFINSMKNQLLILEIENLSQRKDKLNVNLGCKKLKKPYKKMNKKSSISDNKD